MDQESKKTMDQDSKKTSQLDQQDRVEDKYHQELIPPFLPDQRVFTRNLERRRSPKGGEAIIENDGGEQQQQQQGTPTKPDRYFEAVIRQVRHHPQMTERQAGSSWTFLIHFVGWNNRYDRWCSASQLVPDIPEFRELYEKQQQEEESQRQVEAEANRQKLLRKQQRRKEQQSAKAAAATTSAQQDDYFASSMPFTLKTVMVEEWEKISRRGYDAPYGYDHDFHPQPPVVGADSDRIRVPKAKGPARSVHDLPAAVTIRQLLKHFEKKTRKQWKLKQEKEHQKVTAAARASVEQEEGKFSHNPTTNKDMEAQMIAANNQFKQEIRQFCKGLGRLFEEALPVCLLYPQERPQYQHFVGSQQQTKNEKVSALDVYGCEFLLRLIVRLPTLMGKHPPSLVTDLVVLLQQNRPACFKGKFRPPIYPHEWLDWEKIYYKQVDSKPGVSRNDQKECSDDDLFS